MALPTGLGAPRADVREDLGGQVAGSDFPAQIWSILEGWWRGVGGGVMVY